MKEIKETKRARVILDHASRTVRSLFRTFDHVREKRATFGTSTDEEQDILRAALVFAAAGLDSCLKQLIKDAVPTLARLDSNVQEEFETFVQRQIKSDVSNLAEANSKAKFLAKILASPNPHEKLLSSYVQYLTGESLQSFAQLNRAAIALGAKMQFITENEPKLVNIFKVRNKIIHELDVIFSGKPGHRQRNNRKKADLQEYAELLLQVTDGIINKVQSKIEKSSP
jgi:hypothetical protein